jgi:phenylacetate-CoA ligase
VGSEYHVTLTREEGLDHMRLQVERISGPLADAAALAAAISGAMHEKIMARIDVAIVEPGALPRAFSKAKRITDLRLD